MVEIAVGMVVAWVVAKARRAAVRADGVVDGALDAAVDKVGALVLGKLGSDTAVRQLQAEAAGSGEVGELTRQRVELSLADAISRDAEFAEQLHAAIAEVGKAGGAVAPGGIAISGGVNAQDSGVAFGVVTGGRVSVGRTDPDPRQPGRA